jgi:hypothetical protein
MKLEPDDKIREQYGAWRAEVERSVPTFAETVQAAMRRTQPPRRVWRLRPVVAGIAVMLCLVAIGGVLVRQVVVRENVERHQAIRPVSEDSIVGWSSPTAFLLETPDRKLLRETPRFEREFNSDRRLP